MGVSVSTQRTFRVINSSAVIIHESLICNECLNTFALYLPVAGVTGACAAAETAASVAPDVAQTRHRAHGCVGGKLNTGCYERTHFADGTQVD